MWKQTETEADEDSVCVCSLHVVVFNTEVCLF